MLPVLDALVFSGVWVAAAAAALCAAAARALGAAPLPLVVSLAFVGTFTVYGVDRLRDRERDALRAPLRTAFVVRHRRALVVATAIAAVAAAACAVALGPRGLVLAAVAGGIGLLHRRLKDQALFKAGYVTAVWLLVVVGLPALAAGPPGGRIAWAGATLGAALLANVIAFDVRDGENPGGRRGAARALAVARTAAAAGLVPGLVGPRAIASLAAVPLATLVALLAFRSGERYAQLVIDGALLAGGLAAIALSPSS